MKINGFEIERFGIWSGLTISKLFNGVNVFYGANEAGKSTIMEFMRSVFYGFDSKRRQYARRTCGQNMTPEIPANQTIDQTSNLAIEQTVDQHGNPVYVVSGGTMNIESASGSYNLRRMFHPNGNDYHETIELRNSNSEKEGAQLLRVLISGVDEQTFNNVFAIGLDEIQRIGTLNNTDAAEMLFQLSVGMERVSIVDAIKELTNRRNRILSPIENIAKPSLLTQLINERMKILDDIDASKLLVREYARIKDELKVVDRSVAILEDELAAMQREKRLYEIAKLAEPIWIKRNKIRHEIDAMGKVVVVNDETILKLDNFTNQLTERRKNLQEIKTEYELAKEEIKSQPVNESLLKFAARLEVLLDDESRIIEIDSQIASIENEIKTIMSRISDEDNLIKRGRRTSTSSNSAVVSAAYREERERPIVANVSEHDSGGVNSVSLQNNIFAGYRTAARVAVKAKRRLHHAKEQYTEILGRTKALHGKLKPELSTRNASTIGEAIDNAKELLTSLRRRQTIGQHLSEMTLAHRDLHRANAVLLQNQTMPTWQVAIVGLFGVAGVIPAGLAIFEAIGLKAFESGINPALILGGLLLSAVVIAYKFISEKSSAGKLKQNQRQLNALNFQMNHAKQEAAEIDSRFPDIVSSSIESRCRQLQSELQSLEKLLPIENQYNESAAQLKKLEVRLQRYRELQAASARRWQDWLRSVGLPVDWIPARVKDLVEHSDTANDLKRELERQRLILEQRSRDMRTITDRIDRVIGEAGLTFADSESYVDILRNVKSMLESNEVAVKNREKLKQGLRPFKKRKRDTISELRNAKTTISDLLQQYRVKSIEEIRELNKLYQRHRRLLHQEQGVQRELDAAIGNFCSESVIADILEPRIERRLRAESEFAQVENKNDAGIETVNDDVEINKSASGDFGVVGNEIDKYVGEIDGGDLGVGDNTGEEK
ncbi:MAG: AAA family ATPase, partial [Planctomycetaceae bacterium]|nr:AAA family ATPase [Planctomycetaceae bacterium]